MAPLDGAKGSAPSESSEQTLRFCTHHELRFHAVHPGYGRTVTCRRMHRRGDCTWRERALLDQQHEDRRHIYEDDLSDVLRLARPGSCLALRIPPNSPRSQPTANDKSTSPHVSGSKNGHGGPKFSRLRRGRGHFAQYDSAPPVPQYLAAYCCPAYARALPFFTLLGCFRVPSTSRALFMAPALGRDERLAPGRRSSLFAHRRTLRR